ncbi:MAG: transcription antitermination factor NusB [Gemmatimonadetes bacterium]|nr:transcription antitermination factor NusB [Gemmatimonadota bacterium]MBI2401904.1 transcription antitermination factor NusB [Gemmatimonadota bacterium]
MVLRPETRARARALQLLYAWEVQHRPPLAEVALELASGKDARRWQSGMALAERVAADVGRLDAEIARSAEHWRLERIGAVERNILRLGTLELLGQQTPPAVAIDEAVRLARWFAGPKAPAFVNGVLDALGRRLGRL